MLNTDLMHKTMDLVEYMSPLEQQNLDVRETVGYLCVFMNFSLSQFHIFTLFLTFSWGTVNASLFLCCIKQLGRTSLQRKINYFFTFDVLPN